MDLSPNNYLVILPISCKIFPLNDILTVFPHYMAYATNVDCRKTGQRHHRVMMIYIHIVVSESSMLHA